MSMFRKRPTIIEAVLWDGSKSSFDKIMAMGVNDWNPGDIGSNTFSIMTIDGNDALIHKGDWICKGIHGEFYPCRPDIFEKTYEPV